MNQALKSLSNLRLLMEHGECVATMDSSYGMSGNGVNTADEGVTPLLGGHMI